MNSTSMLDNLLPYLFILGIFVVVLIFAAMFYFVPFLKDKVLNSLKEQYKSLKWNGIMLSITISFLKICLGLSMQFQSERNSFSKIEAVL